MAAPASKPAPTKYRVMAGLNYPAGKKGVEKRAEPGDIVDDLPVGSVSWLLAQGHIEDEGGED